ncbi:MAG: dehydrogenase [Phycisphaerae bacterium]
MADPATADAVGATGGSKPRGRNVSRRALIAGGLAAPLIVKRHVLGGAGYQAPSDTLAIAAVGIGGMGQHYLEGCKKERVVALCDVDHRFAGGVFARYPDARRYVDYREMLEKEADRFDALIIATPDHTHAIIQLAALRMGKHVYSAKPLTHTIHEARLLRKAVEQARVITQTSVQSCASEGACGTTEILMSGVLGPIHEVHVWTPHPVYPCGLQRPKEAPPVPEGLAWDLWLGPAPARPYHPAYHPAAWRAWWDFGTGNVGDMACHSFHVFFNALGLGERSPATVYAYRSYHRAGVFLNVTPTPECESHANVVTWEFPASGPRPALAVHWYDGGMRPLRPPELDHRRPMPEAGLLFVGEKGKMLSGFSGGGDLLLPESRFRDFQRPPKTLPRTIGHYIEWTQGCKTGKPASCPMDYGAWLTEMALLGTLALRTSPTEPAYGHPAAVLEWDAAAMRVTNNDKANAALHPPYRQGWTL